MKILVIGGHGTIGKRVVEHFIATHEVLTGGRSTGDVRVDISQRDAIRKALDAVGPLDAIVCTAGEAKWNCFEELSEEDFYVGLNSKLMGQVNVVQLGQDYLSPEGSITLSTGILADHPVVRTTGAAMVNGALHSFVKAVDLEMGLVRVNAVSLGLVEDAYEQYHRYFPGYNVISTAQVVNAYVRSVEGKMRGKIIRMY